MTKKITLFLAVIAFLQCAGYSYDGVSVAKVGYVSYENAILCGGTRLTALVSLGKDVNRDIFTTRVSLFNEADKENFTRAMNENRFVTFTYKSKRTDFCGPNNHVTSSVVQ